LADVLSDTVITVDPVTGAISAVFSGTVQAEGILFDEDTVTGLVVYPPPTDQIVWQNDVTGQVYQFIAGYTYGTPIPHVSHTSRLILGAVQAQNAALIRADITDASLVPIQTRLIVNQLGQSDFSLPVVQDGLPVSLPGDNVTQTLVTETIAAGLFENPNSMLRIVVGFSFQNFTIGSVNMGGWLRINGIPSILQPSVTVPSGATSYSMLLTLCMFNQDQYNSQWGFVRYDYGNNEINSANAAPLTTQGGSFSYNLDTTLNITVDVRCRSTVADPNIQITCNGVNIEIL
jgi:hypothetical protein